jgi:hypothetical protein
MLLNSISSLLGHFQQSKCSLYVVPKNIVDIVFMKVELTVTTTSHTKSYSFRWSKDLLTYGKCFHTSPRQLLCTAKESMS